LYAGGKGHGEPPTIDWSNDYVDQDHYQKLRIRNWAEAPNYEVVRGPLCIKVRRWGFPHSPIHPLFTPTRMHIDQTYTFYAGQDYFMKEGTMKAIKDFDFSTMRDDEWVLSGYSFNHLLWFDEEGRLQEGPVPADQNESMWGVGFYQDQSRDAFIAMWLDHSSEGWSEILKRNGTPTLHYHQHGQLWSRYPVGSGELVAKKGDLVSQRNAYLVAPYPEEEPAEKIEQVRERLLHPVSAASGAAPQPTEARAEGALARDGETLETAPLKDEMWAALRDVRDEQLYRIDANVVDLGYIYDLKVRDGVAEVLMTMPHKGRPIYEYLVFQGGGRNTEGIRERLLHLDGVKDVLVDFTWEPAWDVSRMTDKGLRAVGLEP
ncbi:MAG: metal-sulfur cluster assembly factor, partial [Candidatus Omnitrophica bacterium]|nr:metal-sulfur cluster assembly factor [Candidatus Omnitrophota bacterium]